jgi:hypothetical protein
LFKKKRKAEKKHVDEQEEYDFGKEGRHIIICLGGKKGKFIKGLKSWRINFYEIENSLRKHTPQRFCQTEDTHLKKSRHP